MSYHKAREFYNRFGSKQDEQAWYEDKAINTLIGASRFSEAESIFEYGCGTGRFAEILFTQHLSKNATYFGIDISETMIELATERLSKFTPRVTLQLTEPPDMPSVENSGVDRFVSTYVLDLLSEADIGKSLVWASRVLRPNGLLCLAGITIGSGLISRMVMSAWRTVFAVNPGWVGGCRPVIIANRLKSTDWEIVFSDVIKSWGVASEVIVARKIATGDNT